MLESFFANLFEALQFVVTCSVSAVVITSLESEIHNSAHVELHLLLADTTYRLLPNRMNDKIMYHRSFSPSITWRCRSASVLSGMLSCSSTGVPASAAAILSRKRIFSISFDNTCVRYSVLVRSMTAIQRSLLPPGSL